MTEAGRNNSHRASLKSEGTVSQNSEMDDYVVATSKSDERCTPCHQCYQARQLGIHENGERRELMRSESVRSTSIQIENVGTECRSDTINTCNKKLSGNFVNVSLDSKGGASRVLGPTPKNARGYLDRPPKGRSYSIPTVREEKRNCVSPYCCGLAVSICVSLLACGGFVYTYINRNDTVPLLSTTAKPEQPTQQPHASALQEQVPGSRVTGRFGLDQDVFKKSGKSEMRWNAIRLSGNPIIASKNDCCLIVPEKGTYGVFSVLTFSIKKEDNVTKLAHFMKLKDYQEGETSFQRKLFAVPVPGNSNNSTAITCSSSFVSFVAMEANGRICIYTADEYKKYLYASRLDNTINIFKTEWSWCVQGTQGIRPPEDRECVQGTQGIRPPEDRDSCSILSFGDYQNSPDIFVVPIYK